MYNFNTIWEITQISNPALASHVGPFAHEVPTPSLEEPYNVAIGEAQFYQAVEAWKTYSASGKEQPTLRYNETPPKSPTTGD